jgi:hypothetical protein
VADYPHLKPAGRRATLRLLWAAAGLGELPGDDGTHDDDGRLILRGSGMVKRFLGSWGIGV